MKRLATMLAAGLCAGAIAQSGILYAPVRTLADQAIKLKAWGSGTISETDEMAFEGGHSIRVSTRNYFQGGMLEFGNPVDLSGAFNDKNNLLRFVIRVADINIRFGGPEGEGAKGGGVAGVGGAGTGGGGAGLPPAGGGRQGGRGSGLAGGPALGAGGAGQAVPENVLRNIRVIVATSDGKKSEAYIPVATSGAGERGWKFVAVPLRAINGFESTNKVVTGVTLSGDAISTFYVGDVRIINDSTPITGDLNYHDLNLALGDEVEFKAWGFGGASVLAYYWDFDSRDGVQVDAEGMNVKRKFRRAGDYVITLTIVDVFGLKKPYTTTCKVKVNP